MNNQLSQDREVERRYFKEFDLKMKGIVCGIEEQTDTYKFIIALKVFESNYEYYPVETSGTVFCVKKNSYAAFADHDENYALGDTIEIGYDKTYLIKCINDSLKFVRKRDNMLLYNIAPPNRRMKEIVALGCSGN